MNSEGVRLTRVWVRCPGCGEKVLASVSDGRVRGYCAVARQRVDFLAETQRIDNPTPETAEISASVKRDYLVGDKTIVIQLKHGISPGKMYRILGGANVELRTDRKPKQQ